MEKEKNFGKMRETEIKFKKMRIKTTVNLTCFDFSLYFFLLLFFSCKGEKFCAIYTILSRLFS